MNHTKNVVTSENIPIDIPIHVDFTVSRLYLINYFLLQLKNKQV